MDLESPISRRFGTTPYFLIADSKTGALDVVRNPVSLEQRGAGVQAVVLLLSRNVGALLTGYCSPVMRRHLEENGVQVISGLAGAARDVLEQYRTGAIRHKKEEGIPARRPRMLSEGRLPDAIQRSWKQVLSMLPMMAGVVLLIGIFSSFVSRKFIASIFSGNIILDTLWGVCAGSVFAGNPINSYVIGGELLNQGVSLFAVTAFMLTWVTVGLVQLPAEIAALGRRFAIIRNVVCFILAFPIAIAVVLMLACLSGAHP